MLVSLFISSSRHNSFAGDYQSRSRSRHQDQLMDDDDDDNMGYSYSMKSDSGVILKPNQYDTTPKYASTTRNYGTYGTYRTYHSSEMK